MKFTSHNIVITSNYDHYMLYWKGTKPNKRRLDLHIIELEPCIRQINKGYGYERDKRYISSKLLFQSLYILTAPKFFARATFSEVAVFQNS